MTDRKLYIIMPAFNEEPSLERLLDKIVVVGNEIGLPFEIVICNDGSSDATGTILAARAASDPRIKVITHKINRGLGESIRDLFEYAAEVTTSNDVVIRLDCDDTHDPRYMPAMLAKLDEGFDVVIASRFAEGGDQHGLDGYRRFVSLSANLFMKFFFQVPNVKEYSCGFRAYRAPIVQQAVRFYGNDLVQLKGLGFTCTLEKLVKLHILNARFAEVGFELRYDLKESESKMIGSVTTLGYLVMTVLYHWPWGGWRSYYKAQLAKEGGKR